MELFRKNVELFEAYNLNRHYIVFRCIVFFFTAVKFGRMSKKQREKVEDEVRFHRAQMRAQTDAAPDSVYDAQQQTPSSSDQFHGHYNGYVI